LLSTKRAPVIGYLVGREEHRAMHYMTWDTRAIVKYNYDEDIAEFWQAFGG